MVNIVNGTTQSINLYNISQVRRVRDKYILNAGQSPVYNIPAGTRQLNARISTSIPLAVSVPFQIVGDQIFAGADAIPTGDLIIVTSQYKAAIKALRISATKLGVPWQPILGASGVWQNPNYNYPQSDDEILDQNLEIVGYLGIATG